MILPSIALRFNNALATRLDIRQRFYHAILWHGWQREGIKCRPSRHEKAFSGAEYKPIARS
jgi:hypothetical protein